MPWRVDGPVWLNLFQVHGRRWLSCGQLEHCKSVDFCNERYNRTERCPAVAVRMTRRSRLGSLVMTGPSLDIGNVQWPRLSGAPLLHGFPRLPDYLECSAHRLRSEPRYPRSRRVNYFQSPTVGRRRSLPPSVIPLTGPLKNSNKDCGSWNKRRRLLTVRIHFFTKVSPESKSPDLDGEDL